MEIVKKIPVHIKRWKGSISVEYGILIALIVLVLGFAVANLGRSTMELFTGLGDSLTMSGTSSDVGSNATGNQTPAPSNPTTPDSAVTSTGCAQPGQGQGNAFGQCGDGKGQNGNGNGFASNGNVNNNGNNGVGDGVGGGSTGNRGNGR